MLDKTSYRILGIIHKHPFIEELKLREFFSKAEWGAQFMIAFDYLGANHYILRGSSETGAVYELTPLGRGEYLQQKRSNIEFRLTQVFAIIGAATGVAGTVLGVISLLS